MFRYAFFVSVLIFSFFGCGRKAPPKVPENYIFPPKGETKREHSKVEKNTAPKGVGGYFVGNSGFAVLYWDFPVKVDRVEIYKNGKLIATLEGTNTFADTTSKVKEGTLYRIVGIRNGKPVAEVVIKIHQ